ncbi:condensation domain-containing protein, partial [Paenibacillus xylanexedens]|uniref:condensation domain-containing protein n=1 Tax=Paenibacillus xylanexedens TaxID=528191 RepID=UPI0021B6828E
MSGQSENQNLQIKNIQSFEHTNYSLSVTIHVQPARIGIKIEFNALEHHGATIRQMISHFESILEQVATRVDLRLDEIELVGESEKRQLLETFNDTTAQYPQDQPIHALFEEQADRTPEAVAVVFEAVQLTYGEL